MEKTSFLKKRTPFSSSKNLGKCVALKISKYTSTEEKLSVNRELKILEYFADRPNIPQNFIIGMHAHDTVNEEYYNGQSKKIYSEKYIILELGGEDLLKFYNEKINKGDPLNLQTIKDEVLVTKIAKGAAKALSQFNEHAIHLDIKPTNFLVHSENNDEIEFKLIDFNTSFLIKDKEEENINKDMEEENININLARKFTPPEIRDNFKLSEKIDTWQFGIMLYELQNKRVGAKTPTYSFFNTPSSLVTKFSHNSPNIQESKNEIIETPSASIFKYEDFDKELNDYRQDESKNSLVDQVIKVIIN
ncbi:unnamed protein product [Meloidogyne enterolobii]|uniref:Uncharacterized protein n=1 Tax=Meloidogyne enterolobii TaxID=390850 RepID=A0ACB0ZPY9_MELEN